MSTSPMILAFDLGTRSLKAALYAPDGRRVAGVQAECHLHLPKPGWAEQDPLEWWDAIGRTTTQLLATGVHPEQIEAVSFCAQMCGMVAVDADAKPLHPALIWLDTRSASIARRITGGFPKLSGYGLFPLLHWLRVASGAPNLAGKDSISKILWLREARPDLWRRTAHVLDVKDFLLLRSTGCAVTTPDCAHLSWLMDDRTNRWSRALRRRAGLEDAPLPKIVSSTDRVGNGLTMDAARHMGLRQGTAVIAGAGDLGSFALAAGSIADGVPHICLSTGGWCAAHLPGRKVDPWHAIGAIRAAESSRYLLVAAQETAGACLEQVSQLLDLPASDPAAIHRLAAEAPPGANGLVFLPWLFGERVPMDDPRLRGGFLNLSLGHGRADMARAVIEGVALNVRWAAGHLLRLARTASDEPVRLLGGVAQSDLMAQTLADVLERTVLRMADPRWGGARGAAICASVALGWETNLADACRRAKEDRRFIPNPTLAALYRVRFRALTRAYANNRTWFHRLAASAPLDNDLADG